MSKKPKNDADRQRLLEDLARQLSSEEGVDDDDFEKQIDSILEIDPVVSDPDLDRQWEDLRQRF